jgi:hypothetical protein
MNICFWCKRITDSSEQDENPVYRDYEFCQSCAENGEQGITFIQVVSESNGNPEIREGLYPTGKWVVVSEENVKKVLTDLPILDTVLRLRQMFINLDDWEKLKLP